jgi:TonB-linked SusC/RagA family outer membrane protein
MKRRTTVLLLLALLPSSPAFGQQGTGRIVGQVTSEGGAPLAGANVVVVGTQIGTLADQDGRYALPGVPAGTHQVQASLIGYATQTMTVTVGAGGTAEANFRLAPQAIALDEVVAVGYGTQRKRDLTGAVASVRGEDLTVRAAPTTAVSNALQGKAPGIQVVTNSGIPGAGARVRIRGTQSITANSEPLYVIDGIPALQGTSSSDPTYNPLNTIDPSEIESIEVLKDASSTAIYGARGANGVVLITTKRGSRGGNQVTLETSYGIQQVTKRIDPLTGPQFLELVNEAYVNSGREPRYTPDQIASAPTYNYVDLMLQDAPQQSHTLTFSGGDERTRYLISGNFVNQEGILIRSGFRRYGARVNLDRTISDRFRIGTSVSFTRMRQDLNRTDNGGLGAGANGILGATNFDPTLPPKDEDGRWNLRAVLGEQLENPLANSMEIENPRQVSRLLGNAYAEFDVMPRLTLRTTFGANFGFERTPEFRPSTSPAGSSNNGWASVYSNQGLELTSENTATYRREVGPGSLEVLGGFSIQVSHFEDQYTAVRDFPSDEFKWNNLGVAKVRESSSTNAVDWALVSFLGRVNYNLKDRYLFTVTGRRDGSSRFGKNNKWAFFPSAAFAWRVIEEDFMRDQQLFSDLKLRLSYGVTGNQAVAEYQSLARLSTYWVGIGENSEIPTQAPSGAAPNPNLKWETQRQFNIGADLGFLGNRVVVTLDAYQSKTSDLLLSVDLPRITGFSSQLQNVGSVQNRGIELGISTVNIDRQNFSWRSTLNLAARLVHRQREQPHRDGRAAPRLFLRLPGGRHLPGGRPLPAQ